MDIKKEIRQLIEQHPFHYKSYINKQHMLYNEIINYNPLITDFKEQLYCYLNDTQPELCKYGNPCRLISVQKGYLKSCIKSNKKECKCYNDNITESLKLDHSLRDNVTKQEIKKKTEQTNLEKYGTKHYFQTDDYKLKNKQTNLDKYGVEFIGQCDIQKDKTKQKNLKKYGADHHMKSDEQKNKVKQRKFETFYEKLNERVEGKYTPLFELNKYNGANVHNAYEWECNTCQTNFVDKLVNGRIPRCPTCYPLTSSKWETEIREYIKEHVDIEANTKQIINPYELDIYIPSKNIAIECNGSYWHSELNGKDNTYHLNKTELCNKQNIQLLHIWDYEYINNPELIKSLIKTKLGLNDKIYARKTQLQVIDNKTKELFLDNNHLQGTSVSKHNFGLYYENELVALMTFGNPRFNKNYEWELIRYCSKQDTNVIGGASKLFKHFIKNYNPTNVISYADRRYSNGNMYKQLGFGFIENSSPNFKYTKDYKTMYNRVQFQKHKLSEKLDVFDNTLTAKQNMLNAGYDKLWDCGNSVWEWNNNV